MEFLENILAFSLKQDLVYSHQSLAEERLLDPCPPGIKTSWQRHSDVSLYVSVTSQVRLSVRLNDVSMERRQDVSVVHLYDVLLERLNDVSKGRNNDAPPLRLHDVSNKSQMKHPMTS